MRSGPTARQRKRIAQCSTWTVNMYGGLARRPEVTSDGLASFCATRSVISRRLLFLQLHIGRRPKASRIGTPRKRCARRVGERTARMRVPKHGAQVLRDKCDDAWRRPTRRTLLSVAMPANRGHLLAALEDHGQIRDPRSTAPEPRKQPSQSSMSIGHVFTARSARASQLGDIPGQQSVGPQLRRSGARQPNTLPTFHVGVPGYNGKNVPTCCSSRKPRARSFGDVAESTDRRNRPTRTTDRMYGAQARQPSLVEGRASIEIEARLAAPTI